MYLAVWIVEVLLWRNVSPQKNEELHIFGLRIHFKNQHTYVLVSSIIPVALDREPGLTLTPVVGINSNVKLNSSSSSSTTVSSAIGILIVATVVPAINVVFIVALSKSTPAIMEINNYHEI